METRSWVMVSRSRTVTALSCNVSKSTVTQKGVTIPWDDHGYYQISLDAGEVTV